MNSKIASACLPKKNQTVLPDTPCYLAGWGFKRKGSPGSWSSNWNKSDSRRLRETDLPILTDAECQAWSLKYMYIDKLKKWTLKPLI